MSPALLSKPKYVEIIHPVIDSDIEDGSRNRIKDDYENIIVGN